MTLGLLVEQPNEADATSQMRNPEGHVIGVAGIHPVKRVEVESPETESPVSTFDGRIVHCHVAVNSLAAREEGRIG